MRRLRIYLEEQDSGHPRVLLPEGIEADALLIDSGQGVTALPVDVAPAHYDKLFAKALENRRALATGQATETLGDKLVEISMRARDRETMLREVLSALKAYSDVLSRLCVALASTAVLRHLADFVDDNFEIVKMFAQAY